MIQPERIHHLNRRGPANGAFVLYWMQASQRSFCNHALEHSIELANEAHLPVVVLFLLIDSYPEANLRHYAFMLEGLRETFDSLRNRGIATVMGRGEPENAIPLMARRASLIVMDRGYTRYQKQLRERVARKVECPVVQVESDAVVPVETASPKEEYTAATLRPKLLRVLLRYVVPLHEREPVVNSFQPDVDSVDEQNVQGLLESLPLDRTVPAVDSVQGGTWQARKQLDSFLKEKLSLYHAHRSEPSASVSSGLSAYLHFGQIAPLEVALAVNEHGGPDADAFLEELIVRRELALNFTYYNERYDSFDCLPGWAKETLTVHTSDTRPYTYTFPMLEAARTHDPYWNAAQNEMRLTGSMHNYMRMYWGKKILEWSATPAEGFETALRLNNKWQLDGRDPNSYAGVAWCFGKHDRPWAERQVFGKVRYMNSAGLERKFDMKPYVERFGDTL